jgi:hypothetical protein
MMVVIEVSEWDFENLGIAVSIISKEEMDNFMSSLETVLQEGHFSDAFRTALVDAGLIEKEDGDEP